MEDLSNKMSFYSIAVFKELIRKLRQSVARGRAFVIK